MIRVFLCSLLMVVFTYVVIGQYQVGDPCDVGDHEDNNGSYRASSNDCSKYLQCDNGIYNERNCSPGLHWNAEEVACDWPQKANCEKFDLEQRDEEGGPCNVGDHAENTGLYRPYANDCGKYLQCLHGTFGVRECVEGLHWNAEEEACDWPVKAKCDPRFNNLVGEVYPLPPIQRP